MNLAMKVDKPEAIRIEAAFLHGVSLNLRRSGSRQIAGSWFTRQDFDSSLEIRAYFVDQRVYDRELERSFPQNRGFEISGFSRMWIFGKRLRSVTIASVANPLDFMLRGKKGRTPRMSLKQLQEHLDHLISGRACDFVVGICSTTGFTEEVWKAPPQSHGVRLVLIAPHAENVWRISRPTSERDGGLYRLFDPEQDEGKTQRVKDAVTDRSSSILFSVSSVDLAETLVVPPKLVLGSV